jgi:hypothetical protein
MSSHSGQVLSICCDALFCKLYLINEIYYCWVRRMHDRRIKDIVQRRYVKLLG